MTRPLLLAVALFALAAAALAGPDASEPPLPPLGLSPGDAVVVVVAHPDDELFLAGTLALLSRAGVDVAVTVATSGTRGVDKSRRRSLAERLATGIEGLEEKTVGTRTAAAAHRLGSRRERETRRALEALGISTAPKFLRFRDGRLNERLLRLANSVASSIAARPTARAVITLGPDGLTGHRDHVAVFAATRVALGRMAAPPRHLTVVATDDRAAAFRPFWRIQAVNPSNVSWTVDVTSMSTQRADHVRCYRTQFRLPDVTRFVTRVLPATSREQFSEALVVAPSAPDRS